MKNFSTNRIFSIVLKALRRAGYCWSGFKLSLEVKRIGKSCKVLSGVVVSGGRNIEVGRNCYFGRNVVLDATCGKIVIADNVEIRDGVKIYAKTVVLGSGVTLGDGVFLNGEITIQEGAWLARDCDLEGKVIVEKAILGPSVVCVGGDDHFRDPVTGDVLMDHLDLPSGRSGDPSIHICEGSWIGHSAIILKAVTVGPKAIVGAGTVVTKNIASGTVVVGNPSREIKKSFEAQRTL